MVCTVGQVVDITTAQVIGSIDTLKEQGFNRAGYLPGVRRAWRTREPP